MTFRNGPFRMGNPQHPEFVKYSQITPQHPDNLSSFKYEQIEMLKLTYSFPSETVCGISTNAAVLFVS